MKIMKKLYENEIFSNFVSWNKIFKMYDDTYNMCTLLSNFI